MFGFVKVQAPEQLRVNLNHCRFRRLNLLFSCAGTLLECSVCSASLVPAPYLQTGTLTHGSGAWTRSSQRRNSTGSEVAPDFTRFRRLNCCCVRRNFSFSGSTLQFFNLVRNSFTLVPFSNLKQLHTNEWTYAAIATQSISIRPNMTWLKLELTYMNSTYQIPPNLNFC